MAVVELTAVELTAAVYGLTAVGTYRPRAVPTLTAVDLLKQLESALVEVGRVCRREVESGGARAAAAEHRLALMIWHRLHPENESFGVAKIRFAGESGPGGSDGLFDYLQAEKGVYTPWTFLQNAGSGVALPRWRDWKATMHHDAAPTEQETAEAEAWLRKIAPDLVAEERELIAASLDLLEGDRRDYVDKGMRSRAKKWERKVSKGVRRAAVVIAQAYRMQILSHLAGMVLEQLPVGTLDPISERLYRLMWMIDDDGWNGGRFDIPAMFSGAVASIADFLGIWTKRDSPRHRDRDTFPDRVLPDLVTFLQTGQRSPAVDLAIGIAADYREWIKWRRSRDVPRSAAKRAVAAAGSDGTWELLDDPTVKDLIPPDIRIYVLPKGENCLALRALKGDLFEDEEATTPEAVRHAVKRLVRALRSTPLAGGATA